MVGCTAGQRDLTEGMFRHLVVTGRSWLALYLARIPAGLAILVPLVAIVCAVSALAAPTVIDDSNVNIPAGLSHAGFGELGQGPRRTGHLLSPLQREQSAECPVPWPARPAPRSPS